MKKVFLSIILTAVLVLIAIPAFCQVDTTANVGTEVGTGIVDLLTALGYKLGIWGYLIIVVCGFIWRKIEKKSIFENHANDLQNIVDTTITERTDNLPHVGLIKTLISKLRGHETTK